MVEGISSPEIARRARASFVEQLADAGPRLLEAVLEASRSLLDKPAERVVTQQRRDNVQALMTHGDEWVERQGEMLRDAAEHADRPSSVAGALVASIQGNTQRQKLQLVDDATVQREIYVSRLSQSIMDTAVWEFNDLSTRIAALEGLEELAEHDIFRPQQLAKICVRAFIDSEFGADAWAGAESALKLEISHLCTEAYHEANRYLIERGVLPEVNLRTLIRRSADSRQVVGSRPMNLDDMTTGGGFGQTAYGGPGGGGGQGNGYGEGGQGGQGGQGGPGGGYGGRGGGGCGGGGGPGGGAGGSGGRTMAEFMRDTKLAPMDGSQAGGGGYGGGGGSGSGGSNGNGQRNEGYAPSSGPVVQYVSPAAASVEATMERFGRTMEQHVQGFMATERIALPSGTMNGALASAQRVIVERVEARRNEGSSLAPQEMVEALRAQKQALKSVANTQEERATIEVVALLFASILTEERIPAAMRVWFARLQMPVLRVALSEPDFFSSAQHPARRLIDRMGACVMGFDAAAQGVGPELENEVARVVQVVEAFPETGRKVFQTVLVEFERFIERYFRDQNETTKKGVSLASQVEQRETLAIQYTIELRKLLDGVPVQDGVRDFMFQVWADVLATTALRSGLQSEETRAVRDTALELVWIASAKTSREERAEVIRRLGPLLAALRQGMIAGGVPQERQETSMRSLNIALTAAFAARTSAIDPDHFARLKQRLEALDEILPDADFEIDDSFALDLSGHESDELEVVAEGGLTPSAGALTATDEMLVGAWYMLEYRDRREPVQLAWQGMRKQLSLFVSARGRCVLFQRRRLAAFLQAQLLQPAQDESLTIAATRSAIDKINADPDRLK